MIPLCETPWAPPADPEWLVVARGELGVVEGRGAANNARVLEYLATTRLPKTMRLKDSTPWCAAFVGWCLEQAGTASTKSASARSYLKWGVALDEPRPGCVAVYSRPGAGPRAGHVGFWPANQGLVDVVLGGNQRDSVCERAYPVARLLGYRWPSDE